MLLPGEPFETRGEIPLGLKDHSNFLIEGAHNIPSFSCRTEAELLPFSFPVLSEKLSGWNVTGISVILELLLGIIPITKALTSGIWV